MNTKTIDGKCYARMLAGGAALLAAHKSELNAMNVFPVADGDTGTNMLHTLEGGLESFGNGELSGIGELSLAFSKKVLLSARGNSGVILSQIFAGITEGLEEYESVDAEKYALHGADELFGPESYHGCDYSFYYKNLQKMWQNELPHIINKNKQMR